MGIISAFPIAGIIQYFNCQHTARRFYWRVRSNPFEREQFFHKTTLQSIKRERLAETRSESHVRNGNFLSRGKGKLQDRNEREGTRSELKSSSCHHENDHLRTFEDSIIDFHVDRETIKRRLFKKIVRE